MHEDTDRNAVILLDEYDVPFQNAEFKIKPAEWLEHILLVSSDRFAHVPNYTVDDLLPWADEMQAAG